MACFSIPALFSFIGDPHRRKAAWRWLLVGLLIRLIVMPFTMHPDIMFVHYFPSLWAYQGVVDVYGYITQHFAESIEALGWFYYPPWTYYTLGIFQSAMRPFVLGFDAWIRITGIGENPPGLPLYLMLPAGQHAFRYIFAMKIPYLVFDMLAGLIVLRIPGDQGKALTAFKFWMLNPVTLYACFMFGQFDVIPACFIVLSLYLARREHPVWAVMALGIGGGYKVIPLVLLPLAAALLGRSYWERIRLFVLGLVPFVVPVALLCIPSQGAVLKSVFPDVLSGKVGAGTNLVTLAMQGMFGIGYLGVLAHALLVPVQSRDHQVMRLRIYFLVTLTLLLMALASSSFHYTVMVTPLLALQMAEKKALRKWGLLFVLALVPLCIVTKPLWGGLLSPLHPAFFLSLPSGDQVIGHFIPYHYVRLVARLTFIGTGVWIVFQSASGPLLGWHTRSCWFARGTRQM